jgi:hypothetical protein
MSRSFKLLQLASVRTFQEPFRTTLSVRPSFIFSFQNQIWENAATARTTWIPVQTHYSLRQVHNSNSTVRTPVYHGPDARMTDMKITCSRSPIRTAVLLVRTRKAFIKELLAVDMRSSGRQYLTVRTLLSNRKDLQRNFWNFSPTFVRPDGL